MLVVKYSIRYKLVFVVIFVILDFGDSIIVEVGVMISMDGCLFMKIKFFGGFFFVLLRKFLGGEFLFVNVFENKIF